MTQPPCRSHRPDAGVGSCPPAWRATAVVGIDADIPVARRRAARTPARCRGTRALWWIVVLILAVPASSAAQDEPRCAFLCAPELKVEPTWTVEHLASRHRIERDGQVARAPRDTVFELIFALDVPTTVPRLGFTLEAIFVPFGGTATHPFTGASASQAGREEIRDNGIEIETEVNVELFDTDRTGGWISSHVDLVDKFSPGETPRAGSVYTHKLDFEWDTAFHVFNRLPGGHWLRNVEIEVSLDYLATGLPRAGDRIGDERFLDRASPWSLSLVTVIPVAPLAP